jgi:hypothetical protein
MDVVLITEPKEFLPRELHTIVHDDGVWHSKVVDDMAKEKHGLLGFDFGDWPSLHPLQKLVYGDKQMCVASEHLLEGPNQIKP